MQHQDDTAGGEVGQNAPLTVASMKMLHCRVSHCPGYVFFPFFSFSFSKYYIPRTTAGRAQTGWTEGG